MAIERALKTSKNRGNFLKLIKLITVFDPILQNHLKNVDCIPSVFSSLSPTIQDELVHLMATEMNYTLRWML